jgi:hypothetical protein
VSGAALAAVTHCQKQQHCLAVPAETQGGGELQQLKQQRRHGCDRIAPFCSEQLLTHHASLSSLSPADATAVGPVDSPTAETLTESLTWSMQRRLTPLQLALTTSKLHRCSSCAGSRQGWRCHSVATRHWPLQLSSSQVSTQHTALHTWCRDSNLKLFHNRLASLVPRNSSRCSCRIHRCASGDLI